MNNRVFQLKNKTLAPPDQLLFGPAAHHYHHFFATSREQQPYQWFMMWSILRKQKTFFFKSSSILLCHPMETLQGTGKTKNHFWLLLNRERVSHSVQHLFQFFFCSVQWAVNLYNFFVLLCFVHFLVFFFLWKVSHSELFVFIKGINSMLTISSEQEISNDTGIWHNTTAALCGRSFEKKADAKIRKKVSSQAGQRFFIVLAFLKISLETAFKRYM